MQPNKSLTESIPLFDKPITLFKDSHPERWLKCDWLVVKFGNYIRCYKSTSEKQLGH